VRSLEGLGGGFRAFVRHKRERRPQGALSASRLVQNHFKEHVARIDRIGLARGGAGQTESADGDEVSVDCRNGAPMRAGAVWIYCVVYTSSCILPPEQNGTSFNR
jgi:hypothetical protein